MCEFVTPEIRIQRLHRADLHEATILLSRAFESNPNHVAAFGPERSRIQTLAGRLFHPVLDGLLERGLILGAYDANALAGVAAVAQPGQCRPGTHEKTRILVGLLGAGRPAIPIRVLRWAQAWARHEPPAMHWHVGPVGVTPLHQGHGIGTVLMHAVCHHIDGSAGLGYLETDRSQNVAFYERHGFVVGERESVLGVPNWFMTRPPARKLDTAPN